MPQPQNSVVFSVWLTQAVTLSLSAWWLTVVHRHLRHHCHGYHVVLILPHQTIRSGVLSREEWLRVTTTTTKIFVEMWKTSFAQLLEKCSDVRHRGHGGACVCPASRCTYGFTGHVTKAYVNYGSVLVGVRWLLAHSVEFIADSYWIRGIMNNLKKLLDIWVS
jgi:hypothetical protein